LSYIKSPEHFINYFSRALRELGISPPRGLSSELLTFYQWSDHYTNGWATDVASWRVRESPEILYDPHFPKTLRRQLEEEFRLTRNKLLPEFSDDFLRSLNVRLNKPGVYFLFNREKEILYIGKSLNLATRVLGSLKERSESKPQFVKFLDCLSPADAPILECYFISKLKPPLNSDLAVVEVLTVKVSNIPKQTDFIPVYKELTFSSSPTIDEKPPEGSRTERL
jgi:hypothetical protein